MSEEYYKTICFECGEKIISDTGATICDECYQKKQEEERELEREEEREELEDNE